MGVQDLLPSNRVRSNGTEQWPPGKGCTHPALLVRTQNELVKMPAWQSMLTNDPQHQAHTRTDWQEGQIAPTLTRGKTAARTPVRSGLTHSWSLSAPPTASFHSTNKKHKLAGSAQQGRNREDSQNKWFRSLLGTSPKSPTRG